MSTAPSPEPVTAAARTTTVISAWSAVSAFGLGREAFRDGLRSGRGTPTELDREQWPAPDGQAFLVPGGSPRELLGRKGTRSMDRATALAVAAVGRLLTTDAGGERTDPGDDTGLVLGTSTGSVSSIMSFTRDSLTSEKPFLVDPAAFPNTVMNCAAGRSAIWHGLRGPNVTVAGGRAAALLALNHARRLQSAGRAGGVVCGAVEEFSAERAWLDWHTRPEADRVTGAPGLLGEGCAVLLLEPAGTAGRPCLAEVAAVEMGLAATAEDVPEVLTRSVGRAMDRAGALPAELWAVSPSRAPGPYGRYELSTLEGMFGPDAVEPPGVPGAPGVGALGDTGAASAAFQIAAVLADAEDAPDAAGRYALVTTADRDGVVGCVVLRLTGAVRPGTEGAAA